MLMSFSGHTVLGPPLY